MRGNPFDARGFGISVNSSLLRSGKAIIAPAELAGIRSIMKSPIIIVGGGLSGLYAARLLARTDFLLVEARERLGGRILSVGADGKPAIDSEAFDLGPSWFWPQMQLMMARLVGELGLTAFAQQAHGDVVVERSPREPVERFGGYGEMASSFRIAGGTAALVAVLAAGLPKDSVRLELQVIHAELRRDGVTLHR